MPPPPPRAPAKQRLGETEGERIPKSEEEGTEAGEQRARDNEGRYGTWGRNE